MVTGEAVVGLADWEQGGDPFSDTPSGNALRRILATAGGSASLTGVVDAYILRAEWLETHPEDRDVLRCGNVLARMLINRGGDIEDLARLIAVRQAEKVTVPVAPGLRAG